MITVTVIGSGNVAQHLIKAILKASENGYDIQLTEAFAREKKNLAHLLPESKINTRIDRLREASIYILAVTDDAIVSVSDELPFENRFVVHTSGSVGMKEPNPKNRRGVFYPLQTFSREKEIDFSKIPLAIESEYPEDYALLETVAGSLSKSVHSIDSEQRKALHVAAVFVCNFVNHLYHIGENICLTHQIPFDMLKPLIEETAKKITVLSPGEAQTGPAIRKDQKTIDKHLEFLKEESNKKIYQLLTQSIQHYVKKL